VRVLLSSSFLSKGAGRSSIWFSPQPTATFFVLTFFAQFRCRRPSTSLKLAPRVSPTSCLRTHTLPLFYWYLSRGTQGPFRPSESVARFFTCYASTFFFARNSSAASGLAKLRCALVLLSPLLTVVKPFGIIDFKLSPACLLKRATSHHL